MGISAAYYLAKKGQGDVILVERDLLAQASTGLCVGGIRQQFSLPANILLSQETIRLIGEFEEEFETKIDFRRAGYLFLARQDETWADFISSVEIQQRYSVPVETLSPEEIKNRWPYLEVEALKGGTFGPEDGYVDPYDVSMAIAKKARRSGVRMLERTEALGIRLEDSRVRGLDTTEGFISCKTIINAAGAWGGKVAKMAGVELPILPYRRQVFITKAFSSLPRPVPMIIDQDTLFYMRGYPPGILMGKSDLHEPSSFHTNVDWSFLEEVTGDAVRTAPVLEQAEILRGWGGLYAITPDENPIIGKIEQVEGLVCAAGFSGHGFQHAPAVGRILSEVLLDNRTDFDLSPFVYSRFEKRRKTVEKRIV
jgi:sarcosine oxidase subunit beta